MAAQSGGMVRRNTRANLPEYRMPCLRHICVAFCTTPIHTLETDSATNPPVLDRLSNNAALKLHKLAYTNPIYFRLPQGGKATTLPIPRLPSHQTNSTRGAENNVPN